MNTLEGNKSVSLDSIESLRRILVARQSKPISYSEAAEIGEALITFYEILGSEAQEEDE